MKHIALTFLCVLAAGFVFGDVQLQSNFALSQRFDYGLEALISTEARFDHGKRTLKSIETMPELMWHFSPQWDFSLGLYQMQGWDTMGMQMQEDLIFTSATYKLQLGRNWNFSHRSSYFFGQDERKELSYWRNLTRVAYTGRLLPLGLTPYLSNEAYLLLQPRFEHVETRLQLGVTYPYNRATSISLFAMLDDLRASTAKQELVPVFGLSASFIF